MKIFDANGYIDIPKILGTKLPFLFVVGGRGTGKTYGALKTVIEQDIRFILMRRTQSQVDLINKPEFSPFKSINRDLGIEIGSQALSKYNVGFYRMTENEDGKLVPSGKVLGYSMALSTISNLRGFDASDVTLLIFDEFIPERHERPIKNEGAGFLNAFETINRNREIQGKPPLQVLCLANANDLGNPIFMELGLVGKAERMKRKGQTYSLDYKRGIGIFLITGSPISAEKQNTALYKVAAGSSFEDMAIRNDFEELKHGSVKPQPIVEYNPVCTVGEITVYKHKSLKQYYITTLRVGDPERFDATDTELKRWYRKYGYLWQQDLKDNILFEDTESEIIFQHYMT